MKEDVLKGYKIGADDYLTKPFDAEILLKKLGVLIQRTQNSIQKSKPKSRIIIGDFIFNLGFELLNTKRTSRQTFHQKKINCYSCWLKLKMTSCLVVMH